MRRFGQRQQRASVRVRSSARQIFTFRGRAGCLRAMTLSCVRGYRVVVQSAADTPRCVVEFVWNTQR